MKEYMFKFTVVSGLELVPNFKPYVSLTIGVQASPETPGSPMSQVKMRRLVATLGSFGPADMFAVDKNLWVRWGIEGGEVRFHCRYYTGRPGKMDKTGKLIVGTMKDFVEGLRLKGDSVSHVGFPADRFESRHYLPYLLGVTDDCPVT